MSEGEGHAEGWRAFAERAAGRLAGNPGVGRLRAVLDTYDRAGGGLIAGGLAYASLLAVLPGLLLGLSAVGWLIRAPADQQQIVTVIAQTLPPFKDLAGVAFQQVSTGAAPTSILAIVTLLWGASRFYANLDTALSRVFLAGPRRNAIDQTVRGVVLMAILVVLPVALVTAGSVTSWITHNAPGGVNLTALLAIAVELASPVGSLVAFVAAVALCYRFVPSERVPWQALRLPAGVVGLALALFTQLYAFIAPRLVGLAAVYGTFVAAFALLAWLSIAFNLLLLGAAWTAVRAGDGPYNGVAPATGDVATDGERVLRGTEAADRSDLDRGAKG
jgi:membrane protein